MGHIVLTVKSIGNTVFTPFTQIFNANFIDSIKANGGDCQFEWVPLGANVGQKLIVIVDETLAQVQGLLAAASAGAGQVKEFFAKFDATGGGKVAGTYDMVDPVTGVAVTIPNKARVIGGGAFAKTTFTSATDAATIALGVETDDAAGLKAAIAISNGANPWDAGVKTSLLPAGAGANYTTLTTATRKIQAVVAVETITAGVLLVYGQYIVEP